MLSKRLPMLTTDEQIEHMISKGIKFDFISEDEARHYLENNNNYFKLRAYRKNFDKHPDGINKGKYIDLDFAALKDLAIIDMRMRYLFLHLILDIEHMAKVKLLQAVEDSGIDPYEIVQEYLRQPNSERVLVEIDRNIGNPYCGGIIKKYKDDFPIWAFLEVISFGTFRYFYQYCVEKMESDYIPRYQPYLLADIRMLRNAAAHNNCLIHDMSARDSSRRVNRNIEKVLNTKKGFTRSMKKIHFSNERTRQIITLLYAHAEFTSGSGLRNRGISELTILAKRMHQHPEFYHKNENVMASFNFITKSLEIFSDYV